MQENNRYRDKTERIEIREVRLKDSHALVTIKGTPTLLIGKYFHTLRMIDVYVACHALWESFEFEMPLGKGLQADIRAVFQSKPFYIEVDLGTEDVKRVLIPKIEAYRRYARPGEKVIFALTDEISNRIKDPALREEKISKTVTKRGGELLDYLEAERLGNFVTVTRLSNFLKYPTGDILNSPKDGRISIADLCSIS